MLDYWLGQAYHAVVVKNDGARVMELFKGRIDADQNLKKQALERLQQLNNTQILNKCFISQKHVEILQSILS